jgi:endo-1,4-beta-xylanase
VWGASAGGHLAALLGTSGDVGALEGDGGTPGVSSRVQAVCDYFGPTDFLQMDAAGSQIDHDSPDSPESLLIGGPIQEHAEAVRATNPITYVTGDDPPFLIVHGEEDRIVPHHQSELLYDALTAADVEVTFLTVKGGGHGFRAPAALQLAEAFFDHHLKGEGEPPVGRQHRLSAIEPPPPPPPWEDPNKEPPPGMHYRTFRSRVIERDVSYLVYLPPGYESSEKRYPVVYWLHGVGGRQEASGAFAALVDEAIRARRAPEMIVIGVNGMRTSMWADSHDGEVPMARIVVEDLVPHVDGAYRTIAGREGRGIEGFSMGGFGAAVLAARYPDRFGLMSVLSGAMHDEESLSGGGNPADWSVPAARRKAIFEKVYGTKAHFAAQSPWAWAERNADALKDTRIRIVVGDADAVVGPNTRYHDLLDRLGIAHRFEVVPGAGHSYRQVMENLSGDPMAFYAEVYGGLSER